MKVKSRRKGRSEELISLRDDKLMRRWYYWTEIQRLRFDDALTILSTQEFFISQERIMAIIRKNADRIDELVSKPTHTVRKPRLSQDQLNLFTGE